VVNRQQRAAEFWTFPRLHLDERHGSVAFHHEIDVTMSSSEASLNDPPSPPPEPPLGDSLSEFTKRLPDR